MKDTKLKQLRVNAEEVNSKDSGDGNQTIERTEIKDSPFHVITIEGESFGVMGDYRLTEKAGNKKDVIKQLETITWNRVIQVVMLLDEIKGKLKTKKEKV
jgi:hypothetical protein